MFHLLLDLNIFIQISLGVFDVLPEFLFLFSLLGRAICKGVIKHTKPVVSIRNRHWTWLAEVEAKLISLLVKFYTGSHFIVLVYLLEIYSHIGLHYWTWVRSQVLWFYFFYNILSSISPAFSTKIINKLRKQEKRGWKISTTQDIFLGLFFKRTLPLILLLRINLFITTFYD